jgi:hypothetical protein
MCLFRIHIRPGGGSASMKETFQYCLDEGLLGVGWRTKTNKNTKDWKKYIDEATQIHGKLHVCKYIEKWVGENDLVWTRSTGGEYYLAKVLSGWEYWVGDKAIQDDIDVANIFRVSFQKVPIDMVPGKVIACFRAPRTIQKVADPKALEYSKYLWNRLATKQEYEVDTSTFTDVFMMLDDEETEDLVFLYLQRLGWYVVPNSRKADTMSFEYLAVRPDSGEKALTQVKTGNVHLNAEEFSKYSERVYLFQSNELYTGNSPDNVTCLKKEELYQFLVGSLEWLPSVFKTKQEMVSVSQMKNAQQNSAGDSQG